MAGKRIGLNSTQRIAKNTEVLLIFQVISKILVFFYIMHTARYLRAEGFELLSFVFAFTGIIGVFTDSGFSSSYMGIQTNR